MSFSLFSVCFNRFYSICLSFSVLFFMVPGLVSAQPVKVGVYENKPLVYRDANGEFQGLTIDVLRYVAKQEKWDLQFVPGSWSECLERLEAGEIDLQVAIAVSAAREKLFNFPEQTLMTNWGRLYRHPDTAIDSLLALDGKMVALLGKDIHASVFTELMKKFGQNVKLVVQKNYDAVLEQVESGNADVGVVNRMYAMQNAQRFQVEATPMIFNPIEVRYAVPKGENAALLQGIDRHLKVLREDKTSLYYKSLEKWFGKTQPVENPTG
ncbi:MAG: transporter substrate-binding domain-containing protein [Thermodesulfobacteriota bacterium]|nr:transporter substrate-binding domain-containing protein [Thermodesulfobacteriota bacterium]